MSAKIDHERDMENFTRHNIARLAKYGYAITKIKHYNNDLTWNELVKYFRESDGITRKGLKNGLASQK